MIFAKLIFKYLELKTKGDIDAQIIQIKAIVSRN